MRKKTLTFFLLAILCNAGLLKAQQAPPASTNPNTISLASTWRFELDPLGEGDEGRGNWHTKKLPETITLPGSTDRAARGYKTHDRIPWRLNRLFKYKGDAWYSKEIYVPKDWSSKDIQLFLERCHWKTKVWINGKPAGSRVSLSVPQTYDVTSLINPGQKNLIMIEVDNDMVFNIGFYASAITEETQTHWNGIIGKIQLRAKDRVNISGVQVYPDVKHKSAKVKIVINNPSKQPVQGKLTFSGHSYNTSYPQNLKPQQVHFSGDDSIIVVHTTLPLGNNMQLWDYFHPTLYRLKVKMIGRSDRQNFTDERTVSFGMRNFGTKGTQFTINGRPMMIRGTLNCAAFPITGYPSMDVNYWLHIFKVAKKFGLNSMRFHSWCPPEAAFEAADQLGFYLEIENPYWDPRTAGSDPATNKFITQEAQRILKTYGNHPSFCMFVTGNELGGPDFIPFVTKLVKHWKKEDPRHLYASSAGYPQIPENNFDALSGPRAQHWGAGLKGRFNAKPLSTDYDYSNYVKKYGVPIVSHEVGQWCVYPNFNIIPKFTGVLRPYNYQIFKKSLREHHMLDQAHDFLMASGKWQVLEYKEEIEASLRAQDYGGYQLLGLKDFPGQGTALVGVLDVFWNPKPYVSAKEFHQFQGAYVPLLRTKGFTWTNNQTFKGTAEFSNYGLHDLKNAILQWKITWPNGKIYAHGEFPKTDLVEGQPTKVGKLSVSLQKIKRATRLDVTLSVEGTNYTNHWSIWIYPKKLTMPKMNGVLVAHDWNKNVSKTLQQGRKVLLLADTSKVRSKVPPGLSSIFWNTNWTNGQAPHTLGILCNPKNHALKYFPTQYHTNWQWWDLVDHSRPMILDKLPPKLKPTVQMIPDWNTNHKIGLVFQAKVGKGKLLMTSIDLEHKLKERPIARQMLYSLEKYVNSDQFNPTVEVNAKTIQQLFKR
jgi:hypothetical protein